MVAWFTVVVEANCTWFYAISLLYQHKPCNQGNHSVVKQPTFLLVCADNVAICPVRAHSMVTQSNHELNPCMLLTSIAHRNGDSPSVMRLSTSGKGYLKQISGDQITHNNLKVYK